MSYLGGKDAENVHSTASAAAELPYRPRLGCSSRPGGLHRDYDALLGSLLVLVRRRSLLEGIAQAKIDVKRTCLLTARGPAATSCRQAEYHRIL